MISLRTLSIGLALVSCLAPGHAQDEKPDFRFETLEATEYLTRRGAAVAEAAGFASWPTTTELYLAPPVSRALFRAPEALSEGVLACTSVPIAGDPWPHCTWSWSRVGEDRKPARDDWLDLHVTIAPSGRAAQEQVLAYLIDNQLPIEAVVERVRSAQRPAGLGHVAVAIGSAEAGEVTALFVRGNVAVRLRGRGTLAVEVIPLAARLDESLAAQTPLNSKELRARTRDLLERR